MRDSAGKRTGTMRFLCTTVVLEGRQRESVERGARALASAGREGGRRLLHGEDAG